MSDVASDFMMIDRKREANPDFAIIVSRPLSPWQNRDSRTIFEASQRTKNGTLGAVDENRMDRPVPYRTYSFSFSSLVSSPHPEVIQ
jgi:hypothetical protein